MRRIIFLGVAIAALAASFYGFMTFQEQNKKEALIHEVFAAQFDQVHFITTQLQENFVVTSAAQGLSSSQEEEGKAVIEATNVEMTTALEDLFAETYTKAELQEKKNFEMSAFALSLRQQERQTLRAMHAIGKRLGRQAIMASVGKEFSGEEVTTLKEVTAQLQTDTALANKDRVQLVAERMQMDPQQAALFVMLLSLSKEDAALEQSLDLGNVPGELVSGQFERAEMYIRLTKLDQVFSEAIGQMVTQSGLEEAYGAAQKDLILFVARDYTPELLEKANTYFSQDIAQSILEKDVSVATMLPEIISTIIDRTHTALAGLNTAPLGEVQEEAPEEVDEPEEEDVTPLAPQIEGAAE